MLAIRPQQRPTDIHEAAQTRYRTPAEEGHTMHPVSGRYVGDGPVQTGIGREDSSSHIPSATPGIQDQLAQDQSKVWNMEACTTIRKDVLARHEASMMHRCTDRAKHN